MARHTIAEEYVEIRGHGLEGRTWSKGSALVLRFDEDGRAFMPRARFDELGIDAHPELSEYQRGELERVFEVECDESELVLGPYQRIVPNVEEVPVPKPVKKKPAAKTASKTAPVKKPAAKE